MSLYVTGIRPTRRHDGAGNNRLASKMRTKIFSFASDVAVNVNGSAKVREVSFSLTWPRVALRAVVHHPYRASVRVVARQNLSASFRRTPLSGIEEERLESTVCVRARCVGQHWGALSRRKRRVHGAPRAAVKRVAPSRAPKARYLVIRLVVHLSSMNAVYAGSISGPTSIPKLVYE